jgi:hypothetical protein
MEIPDKGHCHYLLIRGENSKPQFKVFDFGRGSGLHEAIECTSFLNIS